MKRRWLILILMAVISAAGAMSSVWADIRPAAGDARTAVVDAPHPAVANTPLPDVATLTLVTLGAAVALVYQRHQRKSHR